ncbi:LysR substrate-binding domain-containing protein [Streptomyces sp. NPDC059460]|uniref:LysR substrate-binding domain-containing protein n=1 Tax=Streptomyces sp. NPDC059460 TaxID=3346840 RepID=UPI0036C097F3
MAPAAGHARLWQPGRCRDHRKGAGRGVPGAYGGVARLTDRRAAPSIGDGAGAGRTSARSPPPRRSRGSRSGVRDEPLMWTERAPRESVDWWAVNPRPDGSSPRWGPTNDNVEEMLEQVAEGSAICFAPSSMAQYYARPNLSWVPLTDAEPLRTVLAWVDGADNALVRGFAEVVRELVSDARALSDK